jgi:hypothetical protein
MEEGEGDHCGQYGLLVVDKFETSFKFFDGLTLLSIALCLGDLQHGAGCFYPVPGSKLSLKQMATPI